MKELGPRRRQVGWSKRRENDAVWSAPSTFERLCGGERDEGSHAVTEEDGWPIEERFHFQRQLRYDVSETIDNPPGDPAAAPGERYRAKIDGGGERYLPGTKELCLTASMMAAHEPIVCRWIGPEPGHPLSLRY